MRKISVAVIYGGKSGEHEISILSASSVLKQLNRNKYSITAIGVDKAGQWYRNELADVDPLANKQLQVQGAHAKVFSLDTFLRHQCCFDVIFSLMHGTYGEDGCIQGYLELAQIPYVGCGVLASAVSMDKDMTKRLAMQRGISVTPYLSFTTVDWQYSHLEILQKINNTLIFPLFVKPANTGSSVGINKANGKLELSKHIEYALLYDTKVLVEQRVNAYEIELAVLENPCYGEPPLVSVPGEVITNHEFYDYTAKYLDEKNLQLIMPATSVSVTQVEKLTQLAREIFLLNNCEGMARIDFFVDKGTGEIILNEINTSPGFTQLSMYPLLWQASGLAYADLLDILLQLAIARQARKAKLRREFIP